MAMMTRLMAGLEPIFAAHLGETFPACTVVVHSGGEVVLDAAWGWVDPETRQTPASPEMLFDLASVTKLFTATALFALLSQREGTRALAALETPLIALVPEFGDLNPRAIDGGQDPHSKAALPTPNARLGETVDVRWVTLRHLLTHTSGLPPWRAVYQAAGAVPPPPDQPDPISRPVRWSRALAALIGYPFVGQPDEAVRYSDIGLMLLGETVARLMGSDLETALNQAVFRPLGAPVVFNPIREHGLTQAAIAPTEDDPAWRGRRVWGEVHDENACGVGGVAGHAGAFATARAVAAFGQAWLETVRGGENSFSLDPALAQAAISLQAEHEGARRGLGFALRAAHDASAGDAMSMATFGHTGFTGTSLWIDPAAGLVIACLTNSVYPGREKTGTHEFRRALHNAIAEACR